MINRIGKRRSNLVVVKWYVQHHPRSKFQVTSGSARYPWLRHQNDDILVVSFRDFRYDRSRLPPGPLYNWVGSYFMVYLKKRTVDNWVEFHLLCVHKVYTQGQLVTSQPAPQKKLLGQNEVPNFPHEVPTITGIFGPLAIFLWKLNRFLGGGINPFEKYVCQIGSFPQGSGKKNTWNNHLWFVVQIFAPSRCCPSVSKAQTIYTSHPKKHRFLTWAENRPFHLRLPGTWNPSTGRTLGQMFFCAKEMHQTSTKSCPKISKTSMCRPFPNLDVCAWIIR